MVRDVAQARNGSVGVECCSEVGWLHSCPVLYHPLPGSGMTCDMFCPMALAGILSTETRVFSPCSFGTHVILTETCPGHLESIQNSLPGEIRKTLTGRKEGESLAVPTEVTRYQPERLGTVWVNPAAARRIPASLQTQRGKHAQLKTNFY